jgi:hypothetical protein
MASLTAPNQRSIPPLRGVIVPALIVRLVRLAYDSSGGNGEGREAAAAITPAVGHICVDAEVVPAGGERRPFS